MLYYYPARTPPRTAPRQRAGIPRIISQIIRLLSGIIAKYYQGRMSIYDIYCEEFTKSSKKASIIVRSFSDAQACELEALLSSMNDTLKQMKLEIRSLDVNARKVAAPKIDEYTRVYTSLVSDAKRAKESHAKAELLGRTPAEVKKKIATTTEK